MIDKDKFDENFRYYDNEVIVQVMDIFLGDYARDLQILQKSITERDFTTLNRKAHSLKGVVGYMSLSLSELCYELERKGYDKSEEGLVPLYLQLENDIMELVEDLKVLRKEYSN
jgi:HPt (histidine-containing phosphotransfer) domain-containing protein